MFIVSRCKSSANGVSTASHRQLKVKRGWYEYQGRQPLKQQSTIAEILLKGKWLAEAGFEIDSNVEIQVQQQRIVIIAIANQQ